MSAETLVPVALTFMGLGVLVMPLASRSGRSSKSETIMFCLFGASVVTAIIAAWLPA